MDKIDLKLAQKQEELDVYLSGLQDPTLRQLLSDINALRRAKELVADAAEEAPAPVAKQKESQNGQTSLWNRVESLTMGDAVVKILEKAGQPLHIDEIMQELDSRYGLKPKQKSSLVSNIRKDRQNRFVGKGGGRWGLRDTVRAKPVSSPAHNGSGAVSPLSRAGFSLIGSIKELLPQLHGEFSQPVVYKKLRERHPEVAEHIQKASVATTLRKLQEDGLIEVTFKGYGSEPRRYKRK